ncbi:mitochondrial potassium channel ATP-binding subunit [Neocloeon triangulifer]|uniref:mitochondrial potassium channel ATP-binding subunit n=1 Tax=Neocloeon triangulifer TaxID=2078957 RepID=UPI00286F8E25|nr:mitochondrial potassium channel ATP-binding subunit [Neocloeon triangulifer]
MITLASKACGSLKLSRLPCLLPQSRNSLVNSGKNWFVLRNFTEQSRLLRRQNVLQNTKVGKWTIGIGLAGGLSASLVIRCSKSRVYCDGKIKASSRLVGAKDEKASAKDPPFDWKKFFSLLRPHILHLLAAIVASFVVAALNIQIPQVLGTVVNAMTAVMSGKTIENFSKAITEPALKLVKLYFAQAVFTFGYIYLLSNVGERVASELRKELFASILRQDITFFDKHRTGELINRLTTDVQDFKSSFKMCISQGLRSFAQIVGCAASIVMISPEMTVGMLLVMPSIVVIGTLFGSFLRKFSREAQIQIAQSTSVCEEAISNMRTVRAFAMEGQEQELFARETDLACKMNEKLGLGIGLFQGGTNFFLNGLVLGTLWFGGKLIASNQLEAGDLMAFLVASQTIQRSVAQLSLLFGHLVRGLGAGARVLEYIKLEPTVPLTGGKKIPYHSLFGEVVFENVTFSYPTREGQPVLKNFNLKLPAGKVVAIVGSSGGGKSTIAALLERFYEVDEGRITLDDFEITKLDPSWLRGRAIGFINQEPILFATSVMENIRYGRPNATDLEVIAAARLANADGFINTFPKGYDTVVGERGVTISGGQKQRIAIARALLKNPSILILDEATSALDTESERLVQEALDHVVHGRTTLVIAHRLSTIRNADIIAVVAHGRVVELGDDRSLRRKKGLYWTLVQQQERQELEEVQAQRPQSG